MYKGKISRWIFKVDFLEMRILRIRQYVMWPTIWLVLPQHLYLALESSLSVQIQPVQLPSTWNLGLGGLLGTDGDGLSAMTP